MKNINRNNYPVWFTDYHDGTLDSQRLDELLAFLSDNPDLNEEFEQYSRHLLHTDLPVMPGKRYLRREFGELTASQQEELTAAAAEGDISGSEKEQVMEYISASPYLSDLYKSLQNIRLSPPDIPCPHKNSLKHYPLVVRFRKAAVTIIAAAASVAILLSIAMLVTRNQLHTPPLIGSVEIDPAALNQSEIPIQGTAPEEIAPGNKNSSGTEIRAASVNKSNTITQIGAVSEDVNNIQTEIGTTSGNKSAISGRAGVTNMAGVSPALSISKKRNAGDPDIKEINITESKIEERDAPGNTLKDLSPDEKMGVRSDFKPIPVKEVQIPIITEPIAYYNQLTEMTPAKEAEYDSYGSPRQFFAKNFREKILMEENPTAERLTTIELADATVTGINKLLGWEMKLEKESNNSGMLNSISFTSQLIKFDHKLKNSDK